MIYAIAGTGGVALIAVVALAFKLASASSAARSATSETAAARKELADLEVSSAEQVAVLIKDRDSERQQRVSAETERDDERKLRHEAEAHVAELSAKLARAVIARASAPVSQDGADAVNVLFADPLPGKEPKKP